MLCYVASNGDRSLEIDSLPAGDADDDNKMKVIVIAKNNHGSSEAKVDVRSSAKQLTKNDFVDAGKKLQQMQDEGSGEQALVYASNFLKSAKVH